MNDIAARVVARHLRADAFIRLDPIPVTVADGGEITAADLERLLKAHEIDAQDVSFYRRPDDPPNVIRWKGRGAADDVAMGQLVLHVAYDAERVVVSAEVVLAASVTP